MSEYIRKLKQCIKWFQQLEGNYVSEQEDLRSLLKSAERRCSEMENLMKGKEEELHSISEELKRGVEALQEKSANEESGKLTCDMSTYEVRTEFDNQKKLIYDLQIRLAEAEEKVVEGENLHKKLHNTILELKGNIRVFCSAAFDIR